MTTHSPRSGRLLVVNKADQTLGVVDLDRSAMTGAVQLSGFTGHEVAGSPDGRTAIVPIYGDAPIGVAGGDGRTVDDVDLGTLSVERTVDLSAAVRPHSAVFGSDGLLYVTAELADAVLVLEPVGLTVLGRIETGASQSHMLAVTPDARIGCTGNVEPGSVSVLDLRARRLVGVVDVAARTNRISLDAGRRRAYTADQDEPRLAVVDYEHARFDSWIGLPAVGFGSAVTKAGLIVIALRAADAVAIVDPDEPRAARVVTVPAGPQSIVLNADHSAAYTACGPDGVVVEVDLEAARVARVIPVGASPDGLAWLPEAAAP